MRIVLALGLLCASLATFASPESEALKREGQRALEAGRYEEAIGRFRAATRADPADRDAAFMLGATFNRTGDFAGAYVRLKALEAVGYRNRALDFEIGWSLLGMQRARACVVRLERYEQSVPGTALNSELLGRCYLLLREYDKAEAKLREALARDPGAKPRVDLYLAQVQFGRGERQAAAATFTALTRSDSEVGRALRQGDAALAAIAPPPGVGWRFSVSAAAGHNSNVIGLGNTIPLPTDITSKGASFVRGGFGASYTARLDAATSASVGYGFLLERYDSISAANLEDHYFYGEFARRLSERIAVSLRASTQLTRLGGDHFRTQPAIRPALAVRFGPASTTEFSYTLAVPEYRTSAIAAFERSGEIHAFAVNHVIQPEGSPWSGSIGYAHTENRSEGAEFRSSSDGFSGALRYSFGPRTNITVGASVGRDRYDNPSVFTGFARRDRPESAFVLLNGPLTENLRYYAQVQASRSRSNIAFFDYKQRVLLGGIALDF